VRTVTLFSHTEVPWLKWGMVSQAVIAVAEPVGGCVSVSCRVGARLGDKDRREWV
jgi:hypothetical protein